MRCDLSFGCFILYIHLQSQKTNLLHFLLQNFFFWVVVGGGGGGGGGVGG